MRRERSVSPTLPFDPHQVPVEDLLPPQGEALQRLHQYRERSRSRSPHNEPNSPASGSSINSARLRSSVRPYGEEGDHLRVSKNVRDHDGVIGQIRAHPSSLPEDVLSDFADRVKPWALPRIYPHDALTWDDVQSVILPPPEQVVGHNAIDLRKSRWELYEELRKIPLMKDGNIIHVLHVPRSLTLSRCQLRVERAATRLQIWQLTALSVENWVAHVVDITPEMQRGLAGFDETVRRARGGMRSSPTSTDGRSYSLSTIQDGECSSASSAGQAAPARFTTIVHVSLGINPLEIHAFAVNHEHIVEELIIQMAGVLGLLPHQILLTAGRNVPKLDDKVQAFAGKAFVAYPTTFFHDSQYFWREVPAQMWSQWFQQWGHRQPFLYSPWERQQSGNTMPQVDTAPVSFAPGEVSRGGTRKPGNSHEQRSVMLTWAIDKAKRELPHVSIPTITMMMKAEMKTVSSILHSRSANQTYQIIQAAYRRANLQLPDEVKPVSKSRSRTTSPVRTSEPTPGEDTNAGQPDQGEDGQHQAVPVPPEQAAQPNQSQSAPQSQSDARFSAIVSELAAMRQAMTNQATITGQILDIMSAMPKNEDYMALVQAIKSQSQAHSEASMHIAKMVASLETRLGVWETTYLPTLLERMPHGVPPSPTSSRDEHDPPPVEGYDTASVDLSAVRMQDSLHTTVVQRLQDASLQGTCARVVETEEASRRAVRPFRATR